MTGPANARLGTNHGTKPVLQSHELGGLRSVPFSKLTILESYKTMRFATLLSLFKDLGLVDFTSLLP